MSKAKSAGFLLFAELVHTLATSTKTNDKLDALVQYFNQASGADKVWLIALFSGRRPRRIASGALLARWCVELSGLPEWLFDECYHVVGDLGETIALLLPATVDEEYIEGDLCVFLEQILNLQNAAESEKKVFITGAWRQMNTDQRFVFNKLLTGVFRIGISQKTVVNALSLSTGIPPAEIAHRISGNWDPVITEFENLLSDDAVNIDASKPYPFYLAHALTAGLETLGGEAEWQVEWKWDGIRGQVIKRADELYVWSRGEELMTEKFPEYLILRDQLPNGTAIDGEIIPMQDGAPMPFSLLQTRIGRKALSKKVLEQAPIAFIAYDLLEWEGADIRSWPLEKRRSLLERLVENVQSPVLSLSPVVNFEHWHELASLRQDARAYHAEGFMLKRKQSAYGTGRKTGDWWKWKVDPLTIDAVMIYAQKGHGRRSNLYTDYTFAVLDGERLVPFAKAYSGLTDKEIARVDAFVKRNSLEKFGPVRTVKPELVFEIAFEGIAESKRHKSGVAVRFPRISRWRHDKPVEEINTLEDLQAMLQVYGNA